MNLLFASILLQYPDYEDFFSQSPCAFFRNKDGDEVWISFHESTRNISNVHFRQYSGFSRPHTEGPACTEYYENGKVAAEEFWEDGWCYRPLTEGPARIKYDEDENITYVKFCGQKRTKTS